MYVYIYSDPARPFEPLYSGMGRGERAYKHLKRAANWQLRKELAAMRREDREPAIRVFDAPSREAASAYEIFWISVYGRRDLDTGCLCNETDGGDGGDTSASFTDESRAKIRAAHLGRKHSEEAKLKMRKPKSDEMRRKLSIAKTGIPRPESMKKQISEKLKGRPAPKTDETRQRMSEAAKKRSPEHAAKIAAGRRAFYERKRAAQQASDKCTSTQAKSII